MEIKSGTLITRPFQPLFLAASDMLRLAFPYFQRIEQSRKKYDDSGEFDEIPRDIWQIEKSLCIAALQVKYAGLEAFLNNIYDEFRKRELIDLPDNYFIPPINKNKMS